jgi:DNA polymerase I
MQEKTLEDYLGKPEEKPQAPETPKTGDMEAWREKIRKHMAERLAPASDLAEAYLLSATYDGDKRCAVLKFYSPSDEQLYFWYDNTGHKPYCLTSLRPEELKNIPELMAHEGLEGFEQVEKLDPLIDRRVVVTRIVARDPLAIGGRPSGCIRDIIPRWKPEDASVKVWEADIKYYENYLYDRNLEVGMPYAIREEEIIPLESRLSSSLSEVEAAFAGESPEFFEYIKNWARLLECPVPKLRYAALDIEVESPTLDRVPSPQEALYRVICASLVASDSVKRVLLLRRGVVSEGSAELPSEARVEWYDDEKELLRQLFEILTDYPIVLTFNGDDFDLRYLHHRAERLGFAREDIPIELGRESALLRLSIHLDLYRFFFNRSIQVYAFDQKYREITLQEVASSLLGLGKLGLDRDVSRLSYMELAAYCLRDSELTYQLAALDDNLVLKLIIALSRIAKMPLEDVSRQGVSNWIRSMVYSEHRRRGILIPTSKEILAEKGVTATHSIIKGKKYRGAVVIEPRAGVNFNVIVLDFSSLYPSIIKRWNLSYETVRCPHEECKRNLIPETTHWVCTKKRGLTSLLIGSLRDLRVRWYKSKAKDPSVPPEVRSWYSAVQRTLKVILNAAYGVFGAEHFVLYCPPVAEATASVGRYAIQEVIEKAQDLGIEVIYGDTDSVFLKNPSEAQIRQLIEWSKDNLGMDLDVDKVYRYTVFSTRKKNYIGVYPTGNVDIKGLTGKKRNTPEFLKKAFADMVNILSQVETEDAFFNAKEKIKGIVKECYSRLKSKEYSLEDLAFTVVLGKSLEDYEKTTPQHVKALRELSKEDQEKIGAGSVVRYVKVRKDPWVKLLSQASLEEIDVNKYVEHIQTTFEQVLDALDISFEEIIGISKLESCLKF